MKHLIIESYLKDSFFISGKIIFCFDDSSYHIPYNDFVRNLARKTSRKGLVSDIAFLSDIPGGSTQAKVRIGIPPDWSESRFTGVALKEWSMNPSADLVIAAYVV